MLQQLRAKRAQQSGFTLIELLIAIVVVGVLAAVVIIGVGSLKDEGDASACKASADAATAAAVVYYANNHAYPGTIQDMVSGGELVPASGVTYDEFTISAPDGGWVISMDPGATESSAPVFSGCPA
jgi:prepilin-type N-terminal cleavage/methylation domain-containing protein